MRRLLLFVVCALGVGVPAAEAATWVSSGPSPAQVSAVGLDPTQPGVVYVGTRGGDVLRSSDAGATWQPTGPTGDHPIAGIAVRGSVVLVASAGPGFSGIGGVLRSFDGGVTWSSAGSAQGIGNSDVGPVAIDPFSPDVMLLGTNGGLFRSTNAGGGWSQVTVPSGVQISDIVFDPTLSGVVYVSTVNRGASRSDNHGLSFADYNQGVAFNSMAALALTGGTLFGSGFGGVVRTPAGAPPATWSDASNGLSGAPPFVGDITAGGAGLLATLDQGIVRTGLGFVSWSASPSPGFAVGSVDADPALPTRIYAAGDGLARSLDGGGTWQRIDGAISGLGTVAVAATAARSALVLTATGLQRTDDLGASFAGSTAGLLGFALEKPPAVVPGDPARVFAFTNSGLFSSADGGRTWTPRDYGNTNTDGVIAVAPSNPQVLYAAGFSGAIGIVKRSDNGGASWSNANSAEASFNFASAIAVDPTDPNRAYLSTSSGLRRTTDGGQHWAPVAGGLPGGATGVVTIDPASSATVYALASGAVWRSVDGGVGWQPLAALPAGTPRDVLLDPQRSATLYVATDQGIFRSQDVGASWQPFSDGLPNQRVNDLSIDRDHLALYAATDGGLAVAPFPPVGGGPGPGPGPVVRRTRGLPRIGRRIPVDGRGVARIRLVCPRSATAGCAGTLRLTKKARPAVRRRGGRGGRRVRRGRPVLLARRRFALAPGERRTLRVQLRRLRLRPGARLRVDARLAVGARRRTVTVVLVREQPRRQARRPGARR